MNVSELKSGTEIYYKPNPEAKVHDLQSYKVVAYKGDTTILLPESGQRGGKQPGMTATFPTERVLAEFQLEKPWETLQKLKAVNEKKKESGKVRFDQPIVKPGSPAPAPEAAAEPKTEG